MVVIHKAGGKQGVHGSPQNPPELLLGAQGNPNRQAEGESDRTLVHTGEPRSPAVARQREHLDLDTSLIKWQIATRVPRCPLPQQSSAGLEQRK